MKPDPRTEPTVATEVADRLERAGDLGRYVRLGRLTPKEAVKLTRRMLKHASAIVDKGPPEPS